MKKLLPLSLAIAALYGCASFESGPQLTGVAAYQGPFAEANITVFDAKGEKRTTTTDERGAYRISIKGLTAPLMITAVEAGNDNCDDSSKPWARCLGSLVAEIKPDTTIANINVLTDRAVSSVASALKLKGPQALMNKGTAAGLDAKLIQEKINGGRKPFVQALKDAGVADVENYDPVTTPMQADGKGIDAVLRVLVHNRGYDNDSGVPGGTAILDADYRYVGNEEPLDLKIAQAALDQARDPSYTRVLIVGDSTASTYEKFRLPRMGWGQVFQDEFKPGAKVKVLNNAKSGRSSRNFYNQGYFREMMQYVRPGDYVIIHHGHNDQNCDSKKAKRGAADVANLCSYPNDAKGNKQFPEGQPQMSFQSSLEVYVNEARAKGAIPLIMTPTTRVYNAERKSGQFPVAHSHYTMMEQGSKGYAFAGDYSQTIKDTAKANQLPLIDIEQMTIDFANAHEADWKNYWLAVDPTKYAFYAKESSGTLAKPDTTHFQEAGARAVAGMVARGIKESTAPELKKLAAQLK